MDGSSTSKVTPPPSFKNGGIGSCPKPVQTLIPLEPEGLACKDSLQGRGEVLQIV